MILQPLNMTGVLHTSLFMKNRLNTFILVNILNYFFQSRKIVSLLLLGSNA